MFDFLKKNKNNSSNITTNQLLINGEQPKKLGKKIKLQTIEKRNINDIIKEALAKKQNV